MSVDTREVLPLVAAGIVFGSLAWVWWLLARRSRSKWTPRLRGETLVLMIPAVVLLAMAVASGREVIVAIGDEASREAAAGSTRSALGR